MKPSNRLFWIVGLSAIFLYIGSKLFDRGIKILYDHSFYSVDYIFKKTDQQNNTILLGNSIFKFGVNPYYIDSIAGVNSINLGYPSSGFITELLFLRKYIENYGPPKNLILGFTKYKFYIKNEQINRYPLYHFLDDSAVVNYFVSRNLPYWRYKNIPLYKYMTLDDYSRFGVLSAYRGTAAFQLPGSYKFKGFYINRLDPKKNIPFVINSVPKKFVYQTTEYEAFDKILQLCQNFKINLLLVKYPSVSKKNNAYPYLPEADTILKNVEQYRNVHILTHFNYAFQESDFLDGTHLTYVASILYSKMIGAELKIILQSKEHK